MVRTVTRRANRTSTVTSQVRVVRTIGRGGVVSIISLHAVLRPAAPSPRRISEDAQPVRDSGLNPLYARDLHPAPVPFIVIDALMWFVGLWAASALRLEPLALSFGLSLDGAGTPLLGLLVLTAIAVAVYTLLGRAVRLHQGRHLVGS